MNSATEVKNNKLTFCRKSMLVPRGKMLVEGERIYFSLHESITEIEDLWNDLSSDEEFSSARYLRTIEQDSPDHLRNLYLIYYSEEGRPIGSILLQCLILKLSDSFRYENYTTDYSLISRIRQKFRQNVVSTLKFRMMTVGNLYLTGQYGFYFRDDNYSRQDQFRIINKTLKILRKELCNTPYRFQGILFKDYFDHQKPEDAKKLGMHEFCPDPNMILPLRSSWNTFDDYLLDMKSKYRVRIKSAMKKFKGIERKELSLSDIEKLYPLMFELYEKILKGSGFVLAQGERRYFLTLKEELKERLKVIGFFLDGKLIGFYTWVLDHDKMDSHFIGFQPSLNHKYQLYFNILLDLINDAISNKAPALYYFRTALEIKSSVGAIPHGMSCYFKHNNYLINRTIIPFAFNYFVPKQQWDQRHPFKSNE